MIIFLFGSETFQSRQKLNQIISQYQTKHKTGLNLQRLDFKENELSSLKETAETQAMFKEKKLIIIENALAKNPIWQKELLDYLKKSDLKNTPETMLVFYEKELAGPKGDLFKFLTQKPVLAQEFKVLIGAKLENWIRQETKQEGKIISPEAIRKLAAEAGNDLWRLAGEIKKLAAFSGQKPVISEQDISLLVKPRIETNIFATIDALARRDKKTALKLLHQHLEKQDDVIYLLTMFIYQFRNLLQLKDLVDKGTPFYQLAQKTKLHPFVIKKSWEQIKNFSLEGLKKIYQKLLDLDLEIKTGRIEAKTALDIFLMTI